MSRARPPAGQSPGDQTNLLHDAAAPGTELLPPEETIRRGFFEIVINSTEPKPLIKLDTTLLPQHVQQLLREAKGALEDAQDVVIDSPEMFTYATAQRKLARDNCAALEDARTAITGRIDSFKEAVMIEFRGDKSLKDGPVPIFDQARKIYDDKLNAYTAAENARRQAEEKRQRELAEAEELRKQEEARRVQEEADRRAEQLRLEAEAAAQQGDDSRVAELVREATEVHQEADERVGEIAQEITLLHNAPVHQAPPPKSSGWTPTTKKYVEVNDPMAFFRGIVEGKIPLVFGAWDQTKLDKQAALLGDDLNYPGCTVKEKKGGSTR